MSMFQSLVNVSEVIWLKVVGNELLLNVFIILFFNKQMRW